MDLKNLGYESHRHAIIGALKGLKATAEKDIEKTHRAEGAHLRAINASIEGLEAIKLEPDPVLEDQVKETKRLQAELEKGSNLLATLGEENQKLSVQVADLQSERTQAAIISANAKGSDPRTNSFPMRSEDVQEGDLIQIDPHYSFDTSFAGMFATVIDRNYRGCRCYVQKQGPRRDAIGEQYVLTLFFNQYRPCGVSQWRVNRFFNRDSNPYD